MTKSHVARLSNIKIYSYEVQMVVPSRLSVFFFPRVFVLFFVLFLHVISYIQTHETHFVQSGSCNSVKGKWYT
jgi:hypothetical protein